jgi:hypothetical protein
MSQIEWTGSNAGNMYGKCRDSQVVLTREPDSNAFGDFFRDTMTQVPVVGGFVSAFVQDTITNNALRQCPGAVTDHTTPYRQTYVLIAVVVMLSIVFIMIPRK